MATNLIIFGGNAARINVKVNPNMTILKASISHYLVFKHYFLLINFIVLGNRISLHKIESQQQ